MRAPQEKHCADCQRSVLTRFQGTEFRCVDCKPAQKRKNARSSYAGRMKKLGITVRPRVAKAPKPPKLVEVPVAPVVVDHDYAFGLWLRGAA